MKTEGEQKQDNKAKKSKADIVVHILLNKSKI